MPLWHRRDSRSLPTATAITADGGELRVVTRASAAATRAACALLGQSSTMTDQHAICRGASHDDVERIERALGRILRALTVALDGRRGAAVVIDRNGVACLVATRGLRAREARYLRASIRRAPPTLPYWNRLRTGRQPIFLDGAHLAAVLPDGFESRIGLGAHFAVPLIGADGELVGLLAIEAPRPAPAQVRVAVGMGDVAATVIVNARTTRAQTEEAARNEALLQIVRDVSRCLPLPELLSVICRRTVDSFGIQRVTVFDYHRRAGAYLPLADAGTPSYVTERFIQSRFTPASTPHRDEVVAGRTIVISRSQDLPPEDRMLLDIADLHSLVMLPLKAENHTSGMLTAGIATPEEFTPAQIRGLEVIAHHAATAIAQARSLRTSEKAARFRAAVSTLAVDLNAETTRAGALELLCARGRAIFRASTGILVLPGGGQLIVAATDDDTGALPDSLATAVTAADHPAARAFASGEVVLANDLPRDPGGATTFRSLLAIPLVGSGGEVAGVLVIGDTARRRHFDSGVADEARILGALAATVLRNLELMTQLHETNAELRRVSSLKDQFLANVSHDLRTPLNVIIGYGQLAQEGSFGTPPAELDDVLGRMIASARQQLTLVEDLLDFSRIELDTLTVRLADVALAPLFAEMEFMLASMLRNRPIRGVVATIAPDLAVHADGDRLRQILINLLSNAAKFTTSGIIEVDAVQVDGSIRVAVRDTGMGIAAENHERIFESFRQVENASSALGAGLGLAIARRLSTLMGGSLTVESALGAGATFWLTLPVARLHDAATPPTPAARRDSGCDAVTDAV